MQCVSYESAITPNDNKIGYARSQLAHRVIKVFWLLDMGT